MRRRAARILAGSAIAVSVLSLAPASSPAASRYSYAGKCEALSAGAWSGTYYMKASGLGTYMLYDSDRRLLSSPTLGGGIGTGARPGPETDWRLRESGQAFALTNLATGAELNVSAAREDDGCVPFPEIGLQAEGTPWTGSSPYAEVKGTIDGHNHVTAYEFLGGDAHCGEPWNRYGVTVALVDCPDHYPNGAGAVLENALYGNPVRTHDPVGWPTFKDWPAPNSQTHEQTYYRWLERAYLGGVRIMVDDLVENDALCDLYPIKHNSCDDMVSIRLQARRIHELEDYVDAQAGGPGEGWFRIVRTPFEARRVVNEGKMAVVLGIETSEIFECGGSEAAPRCDRDQVMQGLDEIEAMGVSSFFPIHKFDNAFGGVRFDGGTFGVAINAANLKETGHFWQIEQCQGDEHDNEQDTALPEESGIIGSAATSLLPPGLTPLYPPAPHCNELGLTPLGEFLIEQMIDRHLMIEVDHESQRSAKRVLEIAEARHYSGVLASHSWTDPHLHARIYRLGGFAEPITLGAENFIDEWHQLRAAAAGSGYRFGIGFGADANGFHAQPPARGADKPSPVSYPFHSLDGRITFGPQVSGQRVYDVNVDGVAQYGLYPDWMEQLRLLAGKPIADDLMEGAEAYLETWERAVGVPGPGCVQLPRRMSRNGFGPMQLGSSPEQALFAAGQPDHREGRAFRWCGAGRPPAKGAKTARAATVFGPAGAELILSTGAALARPRGAERVGNGLFVARRGAGGDRVWGYRKGKLRFVAVASPRVASRPGLLRTDLHRAQAG